MIEIMDKYKTIDENKNEIEQFYSQTIETTKEEKVKMYNKLSKKELIEMLIEANRHLQNKPLTWKNEGFFPGQQTVGDLCPCNPKNGGSGVCGCVVANEPAYSDTTYITEYVTDLIYNSEEKHPTDLEKITNLTLDVQSSLLKAIEKRVNSTKDDKKLGKDIREIFGKKQ